MSSSREPPDEQLTVTSAGQYRALGHPMRHRLLFALGQQPATISQLASALGSHKGNVAHHLKVLREAGLVAVTETRQVRGGTEQYYQRTARRLDFPGQQGTAHAGVMLQAVADEIATGAPEPLLVLRNIRLTADQARAPGQHPERAGRWPRRRRRGRGQVRGAGRPLRAAPAPARKPFSPLMITFTLRPGGAAGRSRTPRREA